MNYTAENLSDRLFSELALDPQAHYYVAYSGGVDSTVLLHLMHESQQQYGFSLTALHVNHNLQQESVGWAEHCASVCFDLGVSLVRVSLQLENKSEVLARDTRYQWFREQMSAGSVLLTAHHQQDRAETLLFNLMRGAGSRGLSSLREVRPFHSSICGSNGEAKLVRPLLKVTQQQIIDYATDHQLHWIEDPSNQQNDYSRNHIRQHLLPALTEFRPDAIQNIARAASNLEQENSLMNEVAICDLVEVREMPKHPLDHSYAICYEDFVHLSLSRQSNLLRFWLNSLQLHTPSKKLLSQLLSAFEFKPSTTTILQEEGVQFRFYKGFMYVMPALEKVQPINSIDWSNVSQPIDLYGSKIRVDSTIKLRSLVQDRQPSKLRLASKVDVLNPKALQGHTLNLKKWLQDIGIPPWRRQAMPLLTINQLDVDVVLCPVDQQMQSDWVSLERPI